MENIKNLYETIGGKAYNLGLRKPEIPEYVLSNLKYSFFDWQKNAFENFLTYQVLKERDNPNKPTHLMFNMATGTGKTMLMASAILYFYKQGYKHYIFFVNQNNIVDKTENNFIDSTHTKYLYKKKIVIDDKTVSVKKVETFSDNPQGIEIKFTTIQKLYNDIHLERENQTTLEDLYKKDIVMLADEAHHLNTDTKSKSGIQEEFIPTELTDRTSDDETERKGWEHTVIELILNKNNKHKDNKNVLLEFTATIPETESIAKKYEDKIIYKFGLKEFLSAGYTKEINLISSTLDKKERVLQALLFQWYRHKIAIKNGIANFKPVILFRSKTIEESKTDYVEFLNWVDNITSKDFDFLKNIASKISQSKSIHEQGKSRTKQVLEFIKSDKINFGEIADWIKNSFAEKNVIITNSKTNRTKIEKTSEEQEKLLNSLENKNNNVRAIFTVDRLTEGWDVLNLFDIVRLYQGQNTGGSTKKTPEATIKEKQLIGRGVRYFPFPYNDKIKNKRKFDDDLTNELRVLEELYYYTYDEESRYISHLKEELRKDGYISDDKTPQPFKLKDSFRKSDFYKSTKVWYNKQIDNPCRKKKTLNSIKEYFSFKYKTKRLEIQEQGMEWDGDKENITYKVSEKSDRTMTISLNQIEKHIIYKALNIKAKQEDSFFQFNHLKENFDIQSIEDFIGLKFLGSFTITVNTAQYNDASLDNREQIEMLLRFFDEIEKELKRYITPKIGTVKFYPVAFEKMFGKAKNKVVCEDEDSKRIAQELINEDWYVLDSFIGTSEEIGLINFIRETIRNLEQKYIDIYLLRNEEVYKIYDFVEGRGFQPDFILFLKGKENMYYQVFIEPKGNEYVGNDGTFLTGKEGWKEEFLLQIKEKYGLSNILKVENKKYSLMGLPFFNMNKITSFSEAYKQVTDV